MVDHRGKLAKKHIRNFTKKLDERRFINTYGKVWQITTKKLILIFDIVLPGGWVIALLLPERYNKEWIRIDRRKD